jgi:hypothetical protein
VGFLTKRFPTKGRTKREKMRLRKDIFRSIVYDGGIAQEAQRIGDQQRKTVDATTPGVVDGSRREIDRAAEGRTRAADNCTSGPVRF